MNKKTLREERTAAEWKNVAQQPAAGGESRKRDLSYMEMEGEHEKRARVSGTEKCRPGYGHFSSRLEEKGKEI